MFETPYSAYDPTDQSGFSFETVSKRWPVILIQVVDQLHRTNQELRTGGHVEKLEECKMIVEKISRLKCDMSLNHELEPIFDDEAHADTYNIELANLAQKSKNTWYTAPWLFAECYLYRLLRSYFSCTRYWKSYDPFFSQKLDVFKKSGVSISQMATAMGELDNCETLDSDKLGLLFNEILQMCLWGNATDLSLLTELSSSDIESLQSVGKEKQESRQEFILRDDSDQVWQAIQSLNNGRVDFVLDNAGFELFTDFMLADFLVTHTTHVSRVVFHPKLIPWFVSDVTPRDFASTFTFLGESSFFDSPPGPALDRLVKRWKQYVDDGIFTLSVPADTPLGGTCGGGADFWTTQWPYWDMKIRAEDLWKSLSESGLVIFKGDLNYRKLTGDVKWPPSTPFQTAIGPLAGSFPLLSLRTCKADVVVGIDQSTADRLDQSGEKWRVNGRYALVSFAPKTRQVI